MAAQVRRVERAFRLVVEYRDVPAFGYARAGVVSSSELGMLIGRAGDAPQA